MRAVANNTNYTQNWHAYNQAQCSEKAMFMDLLADLCSIIEEPEYTFGRPKNKLSEMIFCAAFKVFSMYSGRRFTTDMKNAFEKEYISKVPHYNSIFNYLQKEELTPILENLITKTSLPLSSIEVDFAVDSSGFSTSQYAQWSEYKFKSNKKFNVWIKAHIMVGVKTNIVTSVKLTDGLAGDSPQFQPLVNRTSDNFCIREVSADKAYLSRNNLTSVHNLGGVPFIPFKENSTIKSKGSSIWHTMYHYYMLNQEVFMQHYHKRSNVETAFYMIKQKFGSNVKSKTRTAQFNEVLCKILCHNICVLIQEMHEMGIQDMGIISLYEDS